MTNFSIQIKKLANLRYWSKLNAMAPTVFFRNDDVDVLDASIQRLTDIFIREETPISYQVIPKILTREFINYFKALNQHDLFDIGQHGFSHTDHGLDGEFWNNRTADEKRSDIKAGRTILEKSFPDYFVPIFTPPWEKMDKETFYILKEEGFKAFSAGRPAKNLTALKMLARKFRQVLNTKKHGLFDLSENIDIGKNWKTGTLKNLDELIADFERVRAELPLIGIMIHDKKLDDNGFKTLEAFIQYLKKRSVKIKRMGKILNELDE